ncbi:PTB domain engulfment adapter [Quillaja saponaria]|uniref:PTB domain engulfment adapter n=1 Tax=Quillaja saponaria TaxID=32244 RepID=A0AAD7LUT4_QUISA|nr:PTB domain engulfment adapter [Quillaja saponaria]
MAVLKVNSAVSSGRDGVYVAAVPLRANKGPAQLLMSSAYSLNLWDLQHFMVIIKPSSLPPYPQVMVFDFQPKDPENIFVALEVLSGRAVQGAVLVRKLTRLPRSKCWYVGFSEVDAMDVAHQFNKNWETSLRVGYHDCRDYTNGLVEQLTR